MVSEDNFNGDDLTSLKLLLEADESAAGQVAFYQVKGNPFPIITRNLWEM